MTAELTSRHLWTLFEPVHALPYFSPEMHCALEAVGLQDFSSGYFAARSAPLGPVGPAVVTAAFYNYAPRIVEREIPSVWQVASPDDVLRARRDGAVAALRALGDVALDTTRISEAADVAWSALGAAETGGFILGAANANLARPQEPLAALWLATTALRELRGDCHTVTLLTAGLTGMESLVMRVSSDLPDAPYQASRGWTDDEWSAGCKRLIGLGLLAEDGKVTDCGLELLAEIEAETNRLAAQPWTVIGAEGTARFAESILPLARAATEAWPAEYPIGLPAATELTDAYCG